MSPLVRLAPSVPLEDPTLPPRLPYLPALLRLAELQTCLLPDDPAPILAIADPVAIARQIDAFLQQAEKTYLPLALDPWQSEGLWPHQVPEELQTIPLYPTGIDSCGWAEEHAEYDEPVPFLLTLAAYGPAACAADYPELPLPPSFSLWDLPPILDEMALPAPLTALPLLIRQIGGDTGNFWLDTCPSCYFESPYPLEWEAETLITLAAAWEEAKPALRAVGELCHWVSREGETRLPAIHRQLLDAQLRHHYGAYTLPLPLEESDD